MLAPRLPLSTLVENVATMLTPGVRQALDSKDASVAGYRDESGVVLQLRHLGRSKNVRLRAFGDASAFHEDAIERIKYAILIAKRWHRRSRVRSGMIAGRRALRRCAA